MAKHLLLAINDSNTEHTYYDAFTKMIHQCSKEVIKSKWESLLYSGISHKSALPNNNFISVCLHDIQGEEHDSITTPIVVFQKFVDFVYKQGYFLCSMKDYLHMDTIDRQSCIVCTFDDGYESLLNTAYPILCRYGFTATVFICTSLIGQDNTWNNKDGRRRYHLTTEEIQTLHKRGWEIGSHGVTHRNLLKLDDSELLDELIQSKNDLKKICDCNIQTYAYPYGASNLFIQSCVSKYYEYAFSVDKGGTSLLIDRYQIRRYSISEIYKMLCKSINEH